MGWFRAKLDKVDEIERIIYETEQLRINAPYQAPSRGFDKLMRLVRKLFMEYFSIKNQLDIPDIKRLAVINISDKALLLEIDHFLDRLPDFLYGHEIKSSDLIVMVSDFRNLITKLISTSYYIKKRSFVIKSQHNSGALGWLYCLIRGKKRYEDYKNSRMIISHIKETIDKIYDTVKKRHEISKQLLAELDGLYGSLPKQHRHNVNVSITRMYKDLRKIAPRFSIQSPAALKDNASHPQEAEHLDNTIPDSCRERAFSYITSMFGKGFDEDLVKKRLREVGWQDIDIERIMNSYIISRAPDMRSSNK